MHHKVLCSPTASLLWRHGTLRWAWICSMIPGLLMSYEARGHWFPSLQTKPKDHTASSSVGLLGIEAPLFCVCSGQFWALNMRSTLSLNLFGFLFGAFSVCLFDKEYLGDLFSLISMKLAWKQSWLLTFLNYIKVLDKRGEWDWFKCSRVNWIRIRSPWFLCCVNRETKVIDMVCSYEASSF